MGPKPALGAHRFQITVACIKERIVGKDKNIGAGWGRDVNYVYIHFYTNPSPESKQKIKKPISAANNTVDK